MILDKYLLFWATLYVEEVYAHIANLYARLTGKQTIRVDKQDVKFELGLHENDCCLSWSTDYMDR